MESINKTHNINLNQLRIFHTVAKTGSFTRASKALGLTQPGISKHIKQLEMDMGMPLFDRLNKKVHLTRAGRILLETTAEMFASIAEAKVKIDDLKMLKGGRITIGASYTAGTYLLRDILGQYNRIYPDIELSLDIALSREVAQKVIANELDIGFIGALHPDDRLSLRPIFRDELVLILPPEHPWGNRTSVALAELGDQVIIIAKKGSGTRSVVTRAVEAVGITMKNRVEFGNTEAVKKMVAAGMGISLLSKIAVQGEIAAGSLKALAVLEDSLSRIFYTARLRDKYQTHAVTALMALLPLAPDEIKRGSIQGDNQDSQR